MNEQKEKEYNHTIYHLTNELKKIIEKVEEHNSKSWWHRIKKIKF